MAPAQNAPSLLVGKVPRRRNLAIFRDLLGDRADQIHGNGKRNADIGSAAIYGSVETDELAAQVQEGASRIARIGWRVGLEEVLMGTETKAAAVHRTDNSKARCLPDVKGVADGEGIISHEDLIGIAQRN